MPFTNDDGSQSMEFAMVVPLVVAVAAVVLVVGQILLVHLGAHQTAVTAARLAAVNDDASVAATLDLPSAMDLHIQPPSGERQAGDLLTAVVERRLMLLGQTRTITVSATFVTEEVP